MGGPKDDIEQRFSEAVIGAPVDPCRGDQPVILFVKDETIDEPLRHRWVKVRFSDGRVRWTLTDEKGEARLLVRSTDSFFCKLGDVHEMKWIVR